jgi:hypothetical protein
MVTLCCSLDHSQWNGMEAAKFLTSLRDIVESGAFAESLRAPLAVRNTGSEASNRLVDAGPSKL